MPTSLRRLIGVIMIFGPAVGLIYLFGPAFTPTPTTEDHVWVTVTNVFNPGDAFPQGTRFLWAKDNAGHEFHDLYWHGSAAKHESILVWVKTPPGTTTATPRRPPTRTPTTSGASPDS